MREVRLFRNSATVTCLWPDDSVRLVNSTFLHAEKQISADNLGQCQN